MTPATFYRICLTLWGENWRPELTKLLARHNLRYSRMSFWYWQHGKRSIPEQVAGILEAERTQKKSPKRKESV